MTPSEACVSNWTWWMCRLFFEKPLNADASGIRLVSVTATQSPMFARIARGSTGFVPAMTASASSASTKICIWRASAFFVTFA